MEEEVSVPKSAQLNHFSKGVLGSDPGPHIPPLPPKPPREPLTVDDVPANLLTISDEDFAAFVAKTRKCPAPFKFPEISENPVRTIKNNLLALKVEQKLVEKLTEKAGPGPRTGVLIGGRHGVPIRNVSSRTCTELPGGLFLKSGISHPGDEAQNLSFAHSLGIPAPKFHRMSLEPPAVLQECIEGVPLSEIWPDMTPDQKKDIALQLREILNKMREAPRPPLQGIGACGGGPVRELRAYFDYDGGPFATESEFNKEFVFQFNVDQPAPMEKAFRDGLRSNHKIVFTHGDLKAHNVIIRDGKVVGLTDWEFAGWFPEYWEYVQFVRGWHYDTLKDFPDYVEYIFEAQYPEQLVLWCAIAKRRQN